MACLSKAPILGSGAEVSRLLPAGHIQTIAGFCAHSFISTEPLPLDSFVLMAAEGMAVTASLHGDHMACKTCSFSGPRQGKSDSFRSRSTEKLLSHDSIRRQGLPPAPSPCLPSPFYLCDPTPQALFMSSASSSVPWPEGPPWAVLCPARLQIRSLSRSDLEWSQRHRSVRAGRGSWAMFWGCGGFC